MRNFLTVTTAGLVAAGLFALAVGDWPLMIWCFAFALEHGAALAWIEARTEPPDDAPSHLTEPETAAAMARIDREEQEAAARATLYWDDANDCIGYRSLKKTALESAGNGTAALAAWWGALNGPQKKMMQELKDGTLKCIAKSKDAQSHAKTKTDESGPVPPPRMAEESDYDYDARCRELSGIGEPI